MLLKLNRFASFRELNVGLIDKLVCSFVTVVLAFGIFAHELQMTPDSHAYIQGAVSLMESFQYRFMAGAPITLYPPLTSVFYVPFIWVFGLSTTAIIACNTVLFAASSWLIQRFNISTVLKVAFILGIFNFHRYALSEAPWIFLFVIWLLLVKRNRDFTSGLLSFALILTRYSSIIILNCYHLVCCIFYPSMRVKMARRMVIDSALFLFLKSFVGQGKGHGFGLGLAKFSLAENWFTAYYSLLGVHWGHFAKRFHAAVDWPILFLLIIIVSFVLFRTAKSDKRDALVGLLIVHFAILIQAVLLSITYVWDPNGTRYNFWVVLFAIVFLISELRKVLKLAVAAFLIAGWILVYLPTIPLTVESSVYKNLLGPYEEVTDPDKERKMLLHSWEL